jgi:hypothetical protein
MKWLQHNPGYWGKNAVAFQNINLPSEPICFMCATFVATDSSENYTVAFWTLWTHTHGSTNCPGSCNVCPRHTEHNIHHHFLPQDVTALSSTLSPHCSLHYVWFVEMPHNLWLIVTQFPALKFLSIIMLFFVLPTKFSEVFLIILFWIHKC